MANNKIIPCNFCGKRFGSNQHRDYHITAVHKKVKNFKCTEQDCKSAFALEMALQRHIKLVHKQKVVKRCSYCQKSFKSNYFARKHEIKCKNGPKNSTHCQFCKKASKVNNRKLCDTCKFKLTPLIILERLVEVALLIAISK